MDILNSYTLGILVVQVNKFHYSIWCFELRFHILQPKEFGTETHSVTKLNESNSLSRP